MNLRFIQFRLIPITLAACALFVLVKVEEIATGQQYLARGIMPPAYAADTPEAEEEEEVQDEDVESDADDEMAAEDAEEASDGEVVSEEEASPMEAENGTVSLSPPEDIVNVDARYNQIELDILQSLSKRREEIEQYQEEIAMREKLLEATEMRIDDKIKQMGIMQIDLKELLERSEAKEDSEMRSLVKIYESMKPKEAARIFDELDMDILLEVIDRMSERKAAPLLAAMAPTKAKDVTVRLAEMRQLRQQARKDISDGELAETN